MYSTILTTLKTIIKLEHPDMSAEAATTNESRKHQKRRLVRRIQKPVALKYHVWLAGHCVCLAFGLVYFVFQLFWLRDHYYMCTIAYRLSLIGAAVAFGATMSHKFGLHFLPPMLTLVAQHNFQYLVLTVVWVFTFRSVLKIVPVMLIAVLQLGSHKKVPFIEEKGDVLGSLVAVDEIVLLFYLLLRTVAFRYTLGYQLVLKLIFFWLRTLFDPDTANSLLYMVDKLDVHLKKIKNEKVQHVWEKTKLLLEEKRQLATT